MKKLFQYIPLYLIVAGISSAFVPYPKSTFQDAKANEILQTSKQKFEALEDFSATFQYALSNSTMRSGQVEKSGAFKYKNGMYFIEFGNQEIYCDLESQWLFLKEENEVNISAYDPEEAISIESVYRIYETKANARYEGETSLNGKKFHKIVLNSLEDEFAYNQVTLWINQTTMLMERAELLDKKQTKETVEFNNIQTNTGLSHADFRFNASQHPNVDVYDDR